MSVRRDIELPVQGSIFTTFQTECVQIDGNDAILVVDMNSGRSVTNAAEEVVRFLADAYTEGLPPVFYRDSEGQWDKLVHDGHRFTGFRALSPFMRKRCAEAWGAGS